jgi:hypothetical protein
LGFGVWGLGFGVWDFGVGRIYLDLLEVENGFG